MAKTDGKPAADTLGGMFDQLKRDGLAWASAEQALLQARVSSGVKRVELAAIVAIGALMVTVAGTIVLANVDRKSTRLNSSHIQKSRMPSSA